MKQWIYAGMLGLLLSGPWQALQAVAIRPAKEKEPAPFIDLQPKANHKLTEADLA